MDPENQKETERLERLAGYQILDTPPEQDFDDLTLLASRILGTPMAMISLIDQDRQWFKSRIGMEVQETTREVAFCEHAIQVPGEILVVEDSLRDERFRENPMVTGEPGIRFYAGAPLTTKDGYALGTICVVDSRPHELDAGGRKALEALARQVMKLLEARRRNRELDEKNRELNYLSNLRRAVFHSIPDGLLVTVDDQVVSVNSAFRQIFKFPPGANPPPGISLSEILPTVAKILEPTDNPESEGKRKIPRETRGFTRDGREITVKIKRRSVENNSGTRLWIVEDITADRTEKIRRGMHQLRMRALYEITSQIGGSLEDLLERLITEATHLLNYDNGYIIAVNDNQGRILHAGGRENSGARPQKVNMAGTCCRAAFDGDQILFVPNLSEIDSPELKCGIDGRARCYFGAPLYVNGVRFGVISFTGGKPRENTDIDLDEDFLRALVYWVGSALTRNKFEKRARNLAEVLEISPNFIAIAEYPSGQFAYVNPGGTRLLGFPREEIRSRKIGSLLAPESLDKLSSEVFPAIEKRGTWSGEAELLTVRGGRIPVLATAILHGQPDGEVRLFSVICQDIRKRKEVEQLKTEFVSTVSHELRTPLTSIRGSLGLVTGGALGPVPEKLREILEMANSNAERLVRLINDILDIDKIESGQLDYRFSQVDLVEMLGSAVAENQEFASRHNTTYRLRVGESSARVEADPDRVRQVLDNLLSNAAKFTRPDSVVEAGLEPVETGFRVWVRDKGPGIPPEFQPKLFEKFTQTETGQSKGGTGLGLAISQAILRAHRSRLEVETSADGTCFYFDLPVEKT